MNLISELINQENLTKIVKTFYKSITIRILNTNTELDNIYLIICGEKENLIKEIFENNYKQAQNYKFTFFLKNKTIEKSLTSLSNNFAENKKEEIKNIINQNLKQLKEISITKTIQIYHRLNNKNLYENIINKKDLLISTSKNKTKAEDLFHKLQNTKLIFVERINFKNSIFLTDPIFLVEDFEILEIKIKEIF